MREHDYIVVGAGPAGLQMGYFLEQAGRDYLILEAHSQAGSFFAGQPRHRRLISFNKEHNWFTEREFNLRYDWNSLLTYDSSLTFPEYSHDLYPHADAMVDYLGDFAGKYSLRIQYGTRIVSIGKGFVLTDEHGELYRCRCLLIATGAVSPCIPREIEGIELAEGYESYDLDPKGFLNKRVLIIGTGNSAFEAADHLAPYAATIQIFTAGKLVRNAWQTHYVGDLRAINNNMLEMNQVKMPHLISGATVTRIARQADGSLRVHYKEDVPHWTVPGTMHSACVYDRVIRATGWNYFEPSLFAPDVRPAADAKDKYAALSPMWESSVPGLFFVGAAMANHDRKTTSGFIHGFRHNIRTLFHLLEHRYYSVPLPARSFPLTSEEELEILVQAILTRISTSSAMFHMFGVLGDALVFVPGRVDWFSELPVAYVIRRSEFAAAGNLLTLTLELGFDSFPKGTDSLTFIHPNDPGHGQCVAFIHPVLRHFSGGKMASEVHLQSGVFVRYDPPNEEFALEFDGQRPHHLVFNLVNGIAKIIRETLATDTFSEGDRGAFCPWPEERLTAEAAELPKCIKTHQPGFVPDLEKYL